MSVLENRVNPRPELLENFEVVDRFDVNAGEQRQGLEAHGTRVAQDVRLFGETAVSVSMNTIDAGKNLNGKFSNALLAFTYCASTKSQWNFGRKVRELVVPRTKTLALGVPFE